MRHFHFLLRALCCLVPLSGIFSSYGQATKPLLKLDTAGYFTTRGLDVLVYNNGYNESFNDSKISGIELIHHGIRTVTNGDVRLSPTPEQWDPIPQFVKKEVDQITGTIKVHLSYPSYKFDFILEAKPYQNGVLLSVNTSTPLPQQLVGQAGLSLEFLPSAYFRKTYLMDKASDVLPLYPGSNMMLDKAGKAQPLPITQGKTLIMAPEDAERRVTITVKQGADLQLYDGRNKAQNGWFVVRSLLPAGKTGKIAEWYVAANVIPNWVRQPVIQYSQLGYHPNQQKVAVIELDKNDAPLLTARLLKLNGNGSYTSQYQGATNRWGSYLRYNYVKFDFSTVKESGIYVIEYGKMRTEPFRIAADIYQNAWNPTLDVYFPVAMDHMYVKEAYRIWHGNSHMDDALQAPVNHEHFDLYAQGPETHTPYKPLQHIPGLNVGGWYDAGDFDIRTQTIYAVVMSLVQSWESFDLKRDETSINQNTKHVYLHVPDGKPDLLQQIEHGTLQLLAQHRAVGHAINGIVESRLTEYTHLGDASTKTDNLVYNPKLDSLQSDGFTSGTYDDRLAFTTKSTPLNYGSIAALAAASRALRGYNDTLATACLTRAKQVWTDEHSHAPDLFSHGNTTGGQLDDEEFRAAVELLITTKDKQYANRINAMWPSIEKKFARKAELAVRAIPYLDAAYAQKVEKAAMDYKNQLGQLARQNPYGVFISRAGWAGNGQIINAAITNYALHKAFPQIIDAETVYQGLNYIFGCHPGSNISFVSAVGTRSKEVAYGNNRADFSFIAGGIVPGVLLLNPNFPENKEDWPFLWGENEYVVNLGASYIYLVNAVNDMLMKK